MRIDDVFVLFPELGPQPRAVQHLSGDPGKCFARYHEVQLKLLRVGRILVRGEVTIRALRQILGRWSLLGNGRGLRQSRGREE